MITRAVVSLVLALVLVGALVELSCVAAEHGPNSREAPAGLVTDGVETDPPSALEIDGGAASEGVPSPALTR